jgi:TRAP-type C4-dicarboxylate transport system permease small subunit
MRYLLNSPLSVAYDLTRMYLLPAVVFFGLSTSLRMRVHVGVGILAQRFPLGLQRCCYYLAQGIGTLFFTLVAYQVALLTHKAWVADQVLMGQHAWPLWLSYVAVPIGCGMAALRCLALPFVPAGAHADAAGLAGAPCAPTAKG